jgi:hypothetical protein
MSAKCEHVKSVDHDVPFDEWAALLWQNAPDEYSERPEPDEPTEMLPGPAKVEALAARHDFGEALRHDNDATYEGRPKISRQGRKVNNGAKASPRFRLRADGEVA